jgi:hypothetical protein
MFKNQLLSSVLLLFFTACGNPSAVKETTTAKTETAPTPSIVGNDADEHGCKGSAGFQWSVIKNECIQIFNTGIRLNPKAKDLDQTTSAFVVFKSDDDDAQAELFLPTSKVSIILQKEGKNDAGTWKNADYTLTQWKGMYSLEDSKKTLLYQGAK